MFVWKLSVISLDFYYLKCENCIPVVGRKQTLSSEIGKTRFKIKKKNTTKKNSFAIA